MQVTVIAYVRMGFSLVTKEATRCASSIPHVAITNRLDLPRKNDATVSALITHVGAYFHFQIAR